MFLLVKTKQTRLYCKRKSGKQKAKNEIWDTNKFCFCIESLPTLLLFQALFWKRLKCFYQISYKLSFILCYRI